MVSGQVPVGLVRSDAGIIWQADECCAVCEKRNEEQLHCGRRPLPVLSKNRSDSGYEQQCLDR